MKTDLEVAIVRAFCNSFDQEELYWIFSRSQLEFVLKDLEKVDDSKSTVLARYKDHSLPVVFLEKHFGYVDRSTRHDAKYMVICSVDKQKTVKKIIVDSRDSPKIFKLTRSFPPVDTFTTPENSKHVLGVYSLGKGKIGIVPDIAGIFEGIIE